MTCKLEPDRLNLAVNSSDPTSVERGDLVNVNDVLKLAVGSTPTLKALAFEEDIVTTFTGLSDTPSSYSGYGGYFLRVNSSETGIEFASIEVTDEKVKADSSDSTPGYLADKVDGDSLKVDTTNHYMYVSVDESTITIDTTNHYIKVKDGGIGTTQLANDAVTPAKLDDSGSFTMAGLTVNGDIYANNVYASNYVYAGDLIFKNKWRITEHGDELILVSPDGRRYRLVLEPL